jgi:hypothetical protein
MKQRSLVQTPSSFPCVNISKKKKKLNDYHPQGVATPHEVDVTNSNSLSPFPCVDMKKEEEEE